MGFGKKKKDVFVEGVASNQEVGVDKPEVVVSSPVPPVPPVLSPEDELKLEEVKLYRKLYGGFITPSDIANLPETELRTEEITLQWAILGELRKLNKNMDKALEE